MRFIPWRAVCGFGLAMAALVRLPAEVLEPAKPGSYAVASTDLAVNAPKDGAMFDYLNGKATAQATVYLTDILAEPQATPMLHVSVPANGALYGSRAGRTLDVVLYVLYPTAHDNARADYTFPYKETGDNVFPHMQRAGDAPLWPETPARFPLVIYSGGYNTHGLWHLEHLKLLASHGYIVVDLFHGDGRGPSLPGNLALRGLEVRAAIDFMLADPRFGPHVDAAKIGLSGASAGGHTILSVMGGVDPTGRLPNVTDSRVRAGFGTVPFMGGTMGFWPFKVDAWYFGEDHAGLRRVHVPFFAVYAQKDSNVPPEGVEAGLAAVSGPAWGVMLDGESHLLSKGAEADAVGWELTFFDGWLRGDADAKRELTRATEVRGGVHDHKTIQHGAAASERLKG